MLKFKHAIHQSTDTRVATETRGDDPTKRLLIYSLIHTYSHERTHRPKALSLPCFFKPTWIGSDSDSGPDSQSHPPDSCYNSFCVQALLCKHHKLRARWCPEYHINCTLKWHIWVQRKKSFSLLILLWIEAIFVSHFRKTCFVLQERSL